MSSEWPTVSVIIPARPQQAEIQAVAAARALDYPAGQLEIVIARGRQPAVQRNAALRVAQGEFIYFLDDDARPLPGNLKRAIPQFSEPGLAILGGPNLCPTEAPLIEHVFATTMASWLAFGPSRSRYTAVGKPRTTSEKELILCNLLARRDLVVRLGGFDEALYPNEENALMDHLQQQGKILRYDPGLIVYRRPRSDLATFIRMLLTYGRGRAEQFRLHPTLGSALNFVPPLFVLFLAVLPWWPLTLGWLLLPYAAAVLAQTVHNGLRHGWSRAALSLPLLVATHVSYGVGFWRGLLTPLRSQAATGATEVTLERLSP